jgi:peptide/nickel transport system permease protein
MTTFLIRRLLASVIVIVGVVTLVFAAVRAAPGDPVESILGEQALQVDKDKLRACMDLVDLENTTVPPGESQQAFISSTYGAEAYLVTADETAEDGSTPIEVAVPVPLHQQYFRFLGDIGNGTFGELCDEKGVTVLDKLETNIPPTFQLALASLAIALLIAIPLGIASALKPYSWVDNSSAVLALLGISIPNFWLGPMLLILFSLTLKALPNPGSGVMGVSALILPAITLGTALAAKLTRMTRSSMLEVLNLDYVRTAKAKGLPYWKIVTKHALRNSLIPVVTILGLQFGALLGGAIIVEKIFARPGLGTLLLSSIESRNYVLVQGCVIFIALSYVGVNLLTDLVYSWVDPRIRYD